MTTLKAITQYSQAIFPISHEELFRSRLKMLECVDLIFGTKLSPLYELRANSRNQYEANSELDMSYWAVWDKELSRFGQRTKELNAYGFEAGDIYAVSCFVWHNTNDGEMSPDDCCKLKKLLLLISDIEMKIDTERENNLLWSVYDEDIFEIFMYLRSVISFAAVNNVPLQFV